jgi:hypothetical protein
MTKLHQLLMAVTVLLSACGGGDEASGAGGCMPSLVYLELIEHQALAPLPDPLPPGYEWHAPWLWHPNPSDPWPYPGPAQPAFLGPFYSPGEAPTYVCLESP